jgi:hypothetical protein
VLYLRAFSERERILDVDAQVPNGALDFRVAKQNLDDADVDAVFQQMGGKAVAQRVRSDPLGDLRGLCRIDDDAMELPGSPTWRLLICALLPSAWFRVSHLLCKRR